MSAATLTSRRLGRQRKLFDPSRRVRPDAANRAPSESVKRSDGGRLTLEQQLDGVWEGLAAAGTARCPVCSGAMVRSGAVARCGGCGSSVA